MRGRGGGTALAMGVRGRPAAWEDWQPSAPQCGDRYADGVGGLVNVARRLVRLVRQGMSEDSDRDYPEPGIKKPGSMARHREGEYVCR